LQENSSRFHLRNFFHLNSLSQVEDLGHLEISAEALTKKDMKQEFCHVLDQIGKVGELDLIEQQKEEGKRRIRMSVDVSFSLAATMHIPKSQLDNLILEDFFAPITLVFFNAGEAVKEHS
jgi:hypothetical protein